MEPVVYTRGDLVKTFPTSFSRAALEDHFSSEYVKMIGCGPDLALIQYIAKQFCDKVIRIRIGSLLQNVE